MKQIVRQKVKNKKVRKNLVNFLKYQNPLQTPDDVGVTQTDLEDDLSKSPSIKESIF